MKIQGFHPGIKVIVGEVTPRMDEKDELVKEVNALINTYIESTENTYIIRNGNLRHQKFFYNGDPKHIRRDCIGRYAANIKHALRVAYGRRKYAPPPPPPAQQPQYAQQYHQPSNQQQQQHHQQSNQQQNHQPSNQQQYQEQLQLLLSILFANQNLSASVTNSCNSGEGPWINNRRSDSRVLDVFNECTS